MNGEPCDWCVLWRQHTTQIMVARLEDALNYNCGQLMDKRPGAAVVRMNLTRDQAERYATSMRQVLDRTEVTA